MELEFGLTRLRYLHHLTGLWQDTVSLSVTSPLLECQLSWQFTSVFSSILFWSSLLIHYHTQKYGNWNNGTVHHSCRLCSRISWGLSSSVPLHRGNHWAAFGRWAVLGRSCVATTLTLLPKIEGTETPYTPPTILVKSTSTPSGYIAHTLPHSSWRMTVFLFSTSSSAKHWKIWL